MIDLGIVIGRLAAQGDCMRQHIKLAFAAGILLALGATDIASAADMAVKARPVVAPVTPWTGCYVGGNVGGGWTQLDTTRISNDAVGPAVANYGREKDSGFIGGGQVGCDFQTGSLVLGVQGMFDFGNINGQHAIPDFPTFSETNNLKSIITGTGRFGWLFTPAFLTYGKFGIAWLNDRNQVFTPGGALVESSSFTVPGWTAGIGGEWMFAPNWSVFAEYNYMWFLDDTATHLNPAPGFAGEVINVRQKAQTVLVGVNYKFHWDGPVVAKY
jgi:outer membrane immunogenic protein